MVENDFFLTTSQPSTAEYKDRGSKFIAFTFPISSVQDFKDRIAEIKKEHPKASHYCFAYRIGIDGNTFRVSDDGEPSGTAGRPILGQIDSKKLTNVLIVVVRYFGGTLLGVPGLVNAYKTVASLALQVTPFVQKAIEETVTLQFDYTMMNEVMTVIKQYNCTVISQELQLFCNMKIGIPKNRLDDILYKLKEIRGVEIGT